MTESSSNIVEMTPGDTNLLHSCLMLNQDSMPSVNSLTDQDMRTLVETCEYSRALLDATGDLQGFLLALGPGHDYGSTNYRWFLENQQGWIYIDRIAVSPNHFRKGCGKRLYDDLAAFAGERGFVSLGCEVNLDPPNPRSMEFHEAMGFEAVGVAPFHSDGKIKTVQYMVKRL